MTGLSSPSPSDPAGSALARRIAVTLAALAIYRAGVWIPLPGVNVDAFATAFDAGSPQAAVGRISVMALGVVPWLSMLLLAELAMIALPPLRRWATARENAASFQGWILLGSLALAGYQATGIATALEGVSSFVAEPGLAFRFGMIATLVAATAVLMWIASLVSRYGLGSGFLLLLAAPFLIDFVGMLAAQAVAWGPASELSIPLTLALFIAAAAALVRVAGSPASAAATGQLLWPPLLAYLAATWLPLLIALTLTPEHLNVVIEALTPGQPMRIVLIPALTFVFSLWRAHSLAASGEASNGPAPWISALVLAAVMAVFEGLLAFLPVPLALDGRSVVIMVVFALSIMSTLRPVNGPAPERAS